MLEYLYLAGSFCFSLLLLICFVLGGRDGIPQKCINFSVVMFTLSIIGSVYTAQYRGHLEVATFTRSDGTVVANFTWLRPISCGALLTCLSMLVSAVLGEQLINCIIHALIACTVTGLWSLSLLSVDSPACNYWMATSMWFSFTLLYHMYSESRAFSMRSPRFARSLLGNLLLYMIVMYTFTLLGPWYHQVISLEAQEIVLFFNDLIVAGSACFVLLHYGWAQRRTAHSQITPGSVSKMNASDLRIFSDHLHSSGSHHQHAPGGVSIDV